MTNINIEQLISEIYTESEKYDNITHRDVDDFGEQVFGLIDSSRIQVKGCTSNKSGSVWYIELKDGITSKTLTQMFSLYIENGKDSIDFAYDVMGVE